MLSSFQRTKKEYTVFTGCSLQVGSPRSIFHSLCLVIACWVLFSALPSILWVGHFSSPLSLGDAPHFKTGLCSKLKWCINIAMAVQEKMILTRGGRGSQGKCPLLPSGKRLHVAPTTYRWQSNRKRISISMKLKYCLDVGQPGTIPFVGVLTIAPKGMLTCICFLPTPVLWLSCDRDIFMTMIKKDLSSQKQIQV